MVKENSVAWNVLSRRINFVKVMNTDVMIETGRRVGEALLRRKCRLNQTKLFHYKDDKTYKS